MNRLRMRLGLFLGIAILVGLGSLYWYFSVHSRTPAFALNSMIEATEKHDVARFNRYVDVDRVLAYSYDDLVLGMIESELPRHEDAHAWIGEFAKMIKAPLITSFKVALNDYVATGEWSQTGDDEDAFDAQTIMVKSGLKATELRDVAGIDINEADGLAVAHLNVYQKEADSQFVLDILLRRGEGGQWRIERIQNFHEFVTFVHKARRAQLSKYAEDSAAVWEEHQNNMRDADFEFSKILAAGSLGQDSTRAALKNLMLEKVVKDWQARKEALSLLPVPPEAASLQHVRLKICDLNIRYALGYAEWMDDKRADTIKDAEAQLKQARVLEQEAEFLARRLDSLPTERE